MSDALRLEQIEYPFRKNWIVSYPWAARPSPGPNRGRIIKVSDVGGDGGSLWQATLAGWVPLNGRVVLASNWGTLAAPVATFTGSGTGSLVPVGGAGSLIIPKYTLLEGRSKIELEALLRRRGVNGTAQYNVRLGTTGTAADPLLYTIQVTAINNRDTRILSVAGFVEDAMLTANYQAPGSGDGVFSTRTSGIDLLADMAVTFDISSANNADAFDLLGYTLTLVSA